MDESDELARYAGLVAPHVDRLFIAGHRAARPFAAPLAREVGLVAGFGALIDLRKLLLAPAGATLKQAQALERYADPAAVGALLREHLSQGLLRQDGESYLPTARGQNLLLRLTALLASGVDRLWGEDVSDEANLAARAIAEAQRVLPAPQYPAFWAEVNGFLPRQPSPAFRLWSHLATLRYLRGDAHALAWSQAGLRHDEAECLTALWRGEYVQDGQGGAMRALGERGWVEQGESGWMLSDAGRQRREAIEATTNLLASPPWSALAAQERARLLGSLASLRETL